MMPKNCRACSTELVTRTCPRCNKYHYWGWVDVAGLIAVFVVLGWYPGAPLLGLFLLVGMEESVAGDYGGTLLAWAIVVGVVGYLFYPVPSVFAVITGHRVRRVIAVNFLLGWTVAGWIFAMVLALKREN